MKQWTDKNKVKEQVILDYNNVVIILLHDSSYYQEISMVFILFIFWILTSTLCKAVLRIAGSSTTEIVLKLALDMI